MRENNQLCQYLKRMKLEIDKENIDRDFYLPSPIVGDDERGAPGKKKSTKLTVNKFFFLRSSRMSTGKMQFQQLPRHLI